MSFSRRGHPLAEEEKSTDAAKARARAMELLAGQELSSGLLYERLGRKFTQPTAAAAVAEMVERQYVDDERYARTRAHGLLVARKSRRAAAGRGLRPGRSGRRPGAGSRRRPRGRAVPRQAGRRAERPCGGCAGPAGVCVSYYKRSNQKSRRRKLTPKREREYYPI